MKLKSYAGCQEKGLSLVGFMFVIVVVALLAVLGMKVVPTVVEYMAIKKAIVTAKEAGTSPIDIQNSFEKQKSANYIDSVSGKELEVTRTEDGFEVTAAYQKKIELIGPVSLVIDYVATTARKPIKKADQ